MKLVLIADTFPPLRTSGAVQLRDLAREITRQGHELTVLLPDASIENSWALIETDGFTVLRLKAPKTKDVNYVQRTLGEFLMPFSMFSKLKRTPIWGSQWEGIIWYSPSIFFGPLIKRLKKQASVPSYLIIRDIFPEWAVDMGLMGRGLPYYFFKQVARYQYSQADVIGIQTPGNAEYFGESDKSISTRVEVLQNWLANNPVRYCSINVKDLGLEDRVVFVYAGNMGIAQGMDILVELACRMRHRSDVGFLFVGRGSERQRLKLLAEEKKLTNVVFQDEIDPDEIPGLYEQCHIGLVSLHQSHRTHNIPGKFLTYMQSGLPVLANVNPGNDLIKMIEQAKVGKACTDGSVESLYAAAELLVERYSGKRDVKDRCQTLYSQLFSPEAAVHQIVNALNTQRPEFSQ